MLVVEEHEQTPVLAILLHRKVVQHRLVDMVVVVKEKTIKCLAILNFLDKPTPEVVVVVALADQLVDLVLLSSCILFHNILI